MYLAFRGTGNAYRPYTIYTCQRIGNPVIKDFVKTRHALFRLYRQQTDRNHVGRELKDNRVLDIIRQLLAHHIELVPHRIGQHVNIIAILEFQGNYWSILTALRSDMLEVLHWVKHILKRFGYILLNILGRGTLIERYHHYGVGVDVGIEVYGKLVEREQT